MEISIEVSKFFASINDLAETEEDVAGLLSCISAGLGAFVFIHLKPDCHEDLIKGLANAITDAAANAAKDPGMCLMQMFTTLKRKNDPTD